MKKSFPYILSLLMLFGMAHAEQPAVIFYESFDNLPVGKTISPQTGKPGEIVGNCNAVEGRFSNAVLPQQGAFLKFPAKDNLNPAHGTVEFWISPQIDLTGKNHINIFSVDFGVDAKLALYWHGLQQEFIFWGSDANDKTTNSQDAAYRFILPGGRQTWKKNEWHHIAVTWTTDSQRIYIDGKLMRYMYFDGGLKVASNRAGILKISGDGAFAIDELRIWDQPRAPRNISAKPSPDDAVTKYPGEIKKLPDMKGMEKLSGDTVDVYCEKGVAEALTSVAGQIQWLYGPVELTAELNGKTIPVKLEWSQTGVRVFCSASIENKSAKVAALSAVLKVPVLRKGLTCFIATDGSPFALEEGRKRYDRAVDASRHVPLPIASVYDVSRDAGISVINPDDTPGEIAYDFGGNASPQELAITHTIKIQPHKTVELKWFFVGHQADWRASLQRYVEINPAIMAPPQGPVATGDQGMVIGGPSDEEFIMPLRELGVGWREVSLFLGEGAGFGNYIPDDLGPYMKAVNGYRQQIKGMHKCGLLAMMYIQARECKNVQQALKDFSASVVRDANGKPEIDRAGPFGVSMTARPGSKWFKHLEDQAQRILKTFPDCDGFFFDNAWSTEFAEIMKAVSALAHSRGKSLTSNGANWMSVSVSDSIMAESAWYCLGDQKYLGLARPVHYVPIYGYGVPAQKEREFKAPAVYSNLIRDLKQCFIAGATYGFNYRGIRYWSSESIGLMKKYVVLQRMLHGRKWVLQPHALALPAGFDGNVFELPDGRWMVTIVTTADSASPGSIVRIRPPVGKTVAKITLRNLHSPDVASPVKYDIKNGEVTFDISGVRDVAAAIIKYEDNTKEGK